MPPGTTSSSSGARGGKRAREEVIEDDEEEDEDEAADTSKAGRRRKGADAGKAKGRFCCASNIDPLADLRYCSSQAEKVMFDVCISWDNSVYP